MDPEEKPKGPDSRAEAAGARELYYAKLEEYLSLQFAGELDAVSLAKKELELAALQRKLDARQERLEGAYASKLAALGADYRKRREDLEENVRKELERADADVLKRKKALEQSYLAKMTELGDKEIQLRAREQTLIEREAEFQKFSDAQKKHLEREIEAFSAASEDEVEARLQSADKLRRLKQDSIEDFLSREKESLILEVGNWKRHAEESLASRKEAEGRLADFEEKMRPIQAGLERQVLRLEKERAVLNEEAARLSLEVEDWRERWLKERAAVFSLQKKLSESENKPAP